MFEEITYYKNKPLPEPNTGPFSLANKLPPDWTALGSNTAVGGDGGGAGDTTNVTPDPGTTTYHPFQLVRYQIGGSWFVKVIASTIDGSLPSSPAPNGDGSYFAFSGGSGYVYAAIIVNDSNGTITSKTLQTGGSAPSSSSPNFYALIGFYNFSTTPPSVTNTRFGPIGVEVCRNWFASSAPYYGVNFI